MLPEETPGCDLKYFVRSGRDAYPYKCNEIVLARLQEEKASYIFVEGPSDKDALERHGDRNCTISPLNIPNKEGKDGVIDFIKFCERFKWEKNVGLHGIVGLVDSDFDGVLKNKPPRLPNRVIYICSGPNDLESIVLCFQGPEILEEILANQKNKNNIWLNTNEDWPEAFDRLVHYVVAPIGALRVTCVNEGLNYKTLEPDKNTNLIYRIWNAVNHSKSLNSDNLINLLPSQFSEQEKNRIRDLVQKEIDKIEKDQSLAWNYVRGKDLVYSIACALANSPNPAKEQESRINALITKWFVPKVIIACELKKKIAEATTSDHGTWQYLR